MTIIYVILGFVWLLLLACYWRDLLRIQYFMALVIGLGLLEKVFYYAEYSHVDREGYSSKSKFFNHNSSVRLWELSTLYIKVLMYQHFEDLWQGKQEKVVIS